MNEPIATIVLRTAKSWVQAQEPVLLWQVTPWVGKQKMAIKAFLRLDARQTSFGATLMGEKPSENLTSDAALTNQIRKHIPTGTILEAWRDAESGDLWFSIYSAGGGGDGAHWYVTLARSRPPELSLMTKDGLTHVTYGGKGTFTKRRLHAGPLPHQEPARFTDFMTSLWHEFQSHNGRVREDPPLRQERDTDADSGKPVVENHEKRPLETGIKDGGSLPETDGPCEIRLSVEQKSQVQRLRRHLKTLRKARAKQASLIPDEAKVAAQDQHARLLQKYLYLAKDGDFALNVPESSPTDEAPISLPLDPDVSLGRNLENAFREVKRLRKAIEHGERGLAKIDKDAKGTEATLAMTLRGDDFKTPDKLGHTSRPIVPKTASRGEAPIAKPYRIFLSSAGHRLLVGKGASDNDVLTKAAKGNDWWIHAVGVTGSHVVIPATKEIRDALPKATLREAAILALHFSKRKSDLGGEVHVARKGDLRKQKGMPKGLWTILRSETLFIRYEASEVDAAMSRPLTL